MMRALQLADLSSNPLAREAELLLKLHTAGVCGLDRLRLTIAGRRLFVDGFAGSVDEKLKIERACRELTPESYLVNRLRVAVAEEPMTTWAGRVQVAMLTTMRSRIARGTEFVWQRHEAATTPPAIPLEGG